MGAGGGVGRVGVARWFDDDGIASSDSLAPINNNNYNRMFLKTMKCVERFSGTKDPIRNQEYVVHLRE